MKLIADIWYCTFDELANGCQICAKTLKMGFLRQSAQWQHIADPDDRRKRLVRYDTLAPRYRELVKHRLCGGYEPGQQPLTPERACLSQRSLINELELAVRQDYGRFAGLYQIGYGTARARDHRQKCLQRAAAVIECIGHYVESRGLSRKSYAPFREAVAWILANRQNFFPFRDLPENQVRLKEKVAARFGWTGPAQPITDIIHLPRQGNANKDRFVHKFPQPLAWAMQLAFQGKGWSDALIIDRVQDCCAQHDIPVPSKSWFAQIFARPDIKRLRDSVRYDAHSRRAQRYQSYRPMEGAVNPGDCWMMDGTRVNLLPHTGADGKPQYLYMVVVYDVYSGDVLGVDWAYAESRYMYYNALKMAVMQAGYVPYELVTDKFPGHQSDEIVDLFGQLEARGMRWHITTEPTGKAPVERWIGTFQTRFLAQSDYYYGQGIQSTRAAARPTSAHLDAQLKAARVAGFDFTAAWQDANVWLQLYRETPYERYSKKGLTGSPRERHETTDVVLGRKLESHELAMLFWPKKELDVRGELIQMQVRKTEVFYAIPADLYPLLKFYGSVTVRYDECDLSRIQVYDPKTDAYLCDLQQGERAGRYGLERPLQDAQRQHYVQNRQEIDAQKRAARTALVGGADDIGLLMPTRLPKAVRENAQTRWLMERMPALMQTLSPAEPPPPKAKRAKNAPAQPPASAPVDLDDFYYSNF